MITKIKPVSGHHPRRRFVISFLGGKCVTCGSKQNLECDHIDPQTKKTALFKRNMPWSEFIQEVKKCQLLCNECHKKKSSKESAAKIRHGTIYAIHHLKCHCETCEPFRLWYNEQRRLKRRKGR